MIFGFITCFRWNDTGYSQLCKGFGILDPYVYGRLSTGFGELENLHCKLLSTNIETIHITESFGSGSTGCSPESNSNISNAL